MNRRPSGFLNLPKGIEGFLQYKTAEGLSPNTIVSYRQHLFMFLKQKGSISVSEIDTSSITQYLSWLRTEYIPKRFTGDTKPLSNKTIRNHWVSLSAFFRWFSNEFDEINIMVKIPAPKFQHKTIEPFSKKDIENLLKASRYSLEAKTTEREPFIMRRPTETRDRSIILTLLDTGLRAGEFCALEIGDYEPGTGKMIVKHGLEGGSKGGRGRSVYIGRIARKSIWRYLAQREDCDEIDAPLFIGKRGRKMNPNGLRQLISALGKKVGLESCYPHLFRHTFAITYLRSGGDIFTLQSLLGHKSLDMVRHYANIAQIDIAKAHRKASPVDNWRL